MCFMKVRMWFDYRFLGRHKYRKGGDMLRKIKLCKTGILLFIGMVFLSSIQAQEKAGEKGLLGFWKFDEKQDIAKDYSGNNNNGKAIGAQIVKGKFGNCLYLNGDAYVSIPKIKGLDGSNELSLEAWVFWEGTGKYPNVITAGPWNMEVGTGGFLIFVNENKCTFRMGKRGKTKEERKEASVPILEFSCGKWYHIVITFKRPGIKTYVDGKPMGSGNWDFPVEQVDEIEVGRWDLKDATAGATKSHLGMIDEVKIYNRALSQEEIKASYEKEAGKRK